MNEKIIPDQIIRSRRKTLSVTVDVFGRVIVRAPLRYGEERIFSFLEEKRDWILRHQTKRLAAGRALPTDNLDGYCFLLLGRRTEIRLYDGRYIRFEQGGGKDGGATGGGKNGGATGGGKDGGSVCDRIFLPRDNARERLVKWLKENAKRIFSAEAEKRAAEMGVSYRSLSVNSAKSRWGSCSANNALHFSFRLLYAPKDVIGYVVVHELAHTVHKDHSRNFWALVERYEPNRKALRAWLKENAFVMEIF